MTLRMFCHAMAVILSINALAVYLVSHSIRAVIVKTLSCALLLQAGYFGSVLFLIWRSRRPGRVAQDTKHPDGAKEDRRQWPTCHEDEE
ncbi:exopolysaccharide production repressor protein [Mesorhizobium sp. WSM3224]|uniref:exopolysaccharide production repressor protein n=1 Tax=Mesorhizobium sp. WSM3224 TaxID=1040986 RepID=UPI000407A615|nr:exopolysaccharide production repressor protein [Mesorhizobium sp. WSM3224]